MSSRLPFYTIGHSTRPLEELVALLQRSAVECVVDVRHIPRSRTNPQYNADALPGSLHRHGIHYVHLAGLGGLRGKRKGAQSSPNTFWDNASFRNYADYALSDAFRAALAALRELGGARTCAIMCAEAVWWRCHRRIIADYLLAAGERVFHILSASSVAEAKPTASAVATADGLEYRA